MIRRVEEHQTFMEGFLAELFKKELVRRFGPAQLYDVHTSTLDASGERSDETIKVAADELTIPLSFPPVRSDEGHALDRVRFGVETGLISDETAIEALGFDPALEVERKGSENAEGNDEPDEEND